MDKPVFCTIVLADDNPDTLETLAVSLGLDGHSVWIALNGYHALELITQFNADIALLDIGMPGMDGYEVARRVRESHGSKHVFLVAVSGWGQQDAQQAKNVGFNLHIVKPIEPDEVKAICRQLKLGAAQ